MLAVYRRRSNEIRIKRSKRVINFIIETTKIKKKTKYKRAQLYMIARHCHQESEKGEGVEVIKYEPCEDPVNGKGHFTEKRLHLYK